MSSDARIAREWARKALDNDLLDEVPVAGYRAAALHVLATTPPTLADMTLEERQACVGMWCDNLASTAKAPTPVVLACVQGEQCWILHTNIHGEPSCFSLESVAPRVDMPRAWNPDGTPPHAWITQALGDTN